MITCSKHVLFHKVANNNRGNSKGIRKILGILFLFEILMSLNTFSQSDFENGYIITNNLDTIYGFINNKNCYRNSMYCDFKETEKGSVKRYFPQNLFGYRFINGKYYVSREIKGQMVFVEYLINGELDMYYYKDDTRDDHYYVSKDTLPLFELKRSEGVRFVNGENQFYISRPYRGILTLLTNDCPEIEDEIPDLAIEHKSLINFAKDYNDYVCKGKECIIYEEKVPRKIKVNLNFGYNYLYLNNTEFDPEITYPFGVQVLIQQAPKWERLYLGVGVSYDNQLDGPFNNIRVPVSLYYLSNKNGLSPVFAFEMDLGAYMHSEAIKAGLKYQVNRYSVSLLADVKTIFVIMPYSASVQFGISYDFN